MYRTTQLAAFASMLAASAVAAEEQPKMPPGVPPRLVTVGCLDRQKGEIGLQYVMVQFVWESVQIEVQREGKTEMATKRVCKNVYETQGWTLSLDSAEAYDVHGKKLREMSYGSASPWALSWRSPPIREKSIRRIWRL